MKKLSARNWFYNVLIALHAMGFLKQIIHPNFLTLDSDDYLLLAENLWKHGIPYSGFLLDNFDINSLENKGLFASRPVLYSLFLLITGATSGFLYIAILLQNVMSVFSIYLIEILFREKQYTIHYPIAIIAILFFPSLWIYANWVMSETLFMFLLSASTYYLLKNNPQFIKSAILLALAMLTKPVLIFIIYIWFAWLLYQFIKSKKRHFAIAAIIPLLTVVLQIAVNQHYTKAWIVSSMPGINLVQYNAYFTLSKKYGADSAANWVHTVDNNGESLEKKVDFETAYQYKKSTASKVLKENLGTYIAIHLQGSMRWFVDPGRFDLLNFFELYDEDGNQGWTRTFYQKGVLGIFERAKSENIFLLLLILGIFLWNIVRLLLIIKKLPILIKNPYFALVITLLIAYFAAVSGPVASARFLLPVFPLILFWAAIAKPRNLV